MLEEISSKLKPFTEALILVGSLSHGRNYSVRKESDIDLVILINNNKIKKILECNLFEKTEQLLEGTSLFEKRVVDHMSVLRQIKEVEVQFHFWDKEEHFKAETLEKPSFNWYCPWPKNKHFHIELNYKGELKKKEIKILQKCKYGDIINIYSHLIIDGDFIPMIIMNNFLSNPPITYTKDERIYENIEVMWKKFIKKLKENREEPLLVDDVMNSISGNWNFSPETKEKIKEELKEQSGSNIY